MSNRLNILKKCDLYIDKYINITAYYFGWFLANNNNCVSCRGVTAGVHTVITFLSK